MPVFNSHTQCQVSGLQYDFDTRAGHLVMGPNSATDMMGCLSIFQAIDPEVSTIVTWRGRASGPVQDTSYVKVDGEWQAMMPPAGPMGAPIEIEGV